MRKHNAENERMKREYLRWLKGAKGRSEATLDIAAAAIDRFEAQTGVRSFKTFRRDQAMSFKEHLAAERHRTTGKCQTACKSDPRSACKIDPPGAGVCRRPAA